MDGIQEQKREAFIHFFFGNLDPFRYVIQTDVDIPFVPDPGDALLFDTVLQMPAVLCREKPALVFYVMDHWQMQAKPVEN